MLDGPKLIEYIKQKNNIMKIVILVRMTQDRFDNLHSGPYNKDTERDITDDTTTYRRENRRTFKISTCKYLLPSSGVDHKMSLRENLKV